MSPPQAAYFTYRHQPLKALYIVYAALVLFLVRTPYWAVTNLLPAWRPRRSWPLSRVLKVNTIREVLRISFQTSIGIFLADSKQLAKSVGFVWIEPDPTLIGGEIKAAAKINDVEPARIGGVWYGQRGPDGRVGQRAGPDERVIFELHGQRWMGDRERDAELGQRVHVRRDAQVRGRVRAGAADRVQAGADGAVPSEERVPRGAHRRDRGLQLPRERRRLQARQHPRLGRVRGRHPRVRPHAVPRPEPLAHAPAAGSAVPAVAVGRLRADVRRRGVIGGEEQRLGLRAVVLQGLRGAGAAGEHVAGGGLHKFVDLAGRGPRAACCRRVCGNAADADHGRGCGVHAGRAEGAAGPAGGGQREGRGGVCRAAGYDAYRANGGVARARAHPRLRGVRALGGRVGGSEMMLGLSGLRQWH